MKKLIKSQSGMSLISVMIASAMVAGLALVTTKMGQNANQIAKTTESAIDILQIQSRIERSFLDDTSCVLNFPKPQHKFTINNKVYLQSLIDRHNNIIIEVDKPVTKNLTTQKIMVERIDSTNMKVHVTFFKGSTSLTQQTIIVGGRSSSENVRQSRRSKSVGGKTITKTFDLEAKFDSQGHGEDLGYHPAQYRYSLGHADGKRQAGRLFRSGLSAFLAPRAGC